jgi:hypothetical protein
MGTSNATSRVGLHDSAFYISNIWRGAETNLRGFGMMNLTEYRGALPTQLGNVQIQEQRCLNRLRTLIDPLSKYSYLSNLRQVASIGSGNDLTLWVSEPQTRRCFITWS